MYKRQSLRAARDEKHPDGRSLTLVKVFGRWRSDSAVKLYGRLDPDAYAGHVSASLAADAASINATRTTEAMNNIDPPLFESMALEQDEAEADGCRTPPTPALPAPGADLPSAARRSLTVARPSKRRRDAPPAPRPRSKGAKASAKGRAVIVPASCFPGETCLENSGKGWSAHAVTRPRGSASVTFDLARDADGRPFQPMLLKDSALLPA